MKKFFIALFLAATMIFNVTSYAAPAHNSRNHNSGTLYQVALLQSLTLGYFDGTVTVKQLKTHGDTGIGTFEGLDGEMIVLDGVVYRANQDCKVNVVKDNVTVPFSNVAFFKEDIGGQLKGVATKTLLEGTLTDTISGEKLLNNFYMVKVHGTFNEITVRSEAKQYKPYPTLVQALQATQKECTFKNISGTIVGLYCPDFMSSLNSTGWHFHFISDDKKLGGHVLELNLKDGAFQLSKLDGFRMILPNTEDFHALNFKTDLKEEIRKAEQDSYQK